MSRRTLRQDVEVLHALAVALDGVPAHKRDRISLQHHRRQVLGLAKRLEKATRPAPPPPPRLPRQGTVARTVLEVLQDDRRGKDYDNLRMLTGLTDAEVAVRITGAGVNSTRPRRIELTRSGLVVAARTLRSGITCWTISDLGRDLLAADHG